MTSNPDSGSGREMTTTVDYDAQPRPSQIGQYPALPAPLNATVPQAQPLGRNLSAFVLFLCVSISAAIGYGFGVQSGHNAVHTDAIGLFPAMAAAHPESRAGTIERATDRLSMDQAGKIQAQILHLQSALQRLADVADLDEGEFDLDTDFFRQGASSDVTSALVKRRLAHISEQTKVVEKIYDSRQLEHALLISGSPVKNARISSRFGYRRDPHTGARQMHRGLDFSGPTGSPIMALADGIVTWAGKNGGYGKLVEIEHAGGFRTRYAHNETVEVALGSRVRKGQLVATMGSTGRSTGTHVHVEVRHKGRALDPQLYIR